MVSTPDGDRAIKTLEIGDIVWSNPEKGGKPFAAAITATHVRNDQPISRLPLKGADEAGNEKRETLLVTPSHPFYVPAQKDFIAVSDLKSGDRPPSLADGATENTSSEVASQELCGRFEMGSVLFGLMFSVKMIGILKRGEEVVC